MLYTGRKHWEVRLMRILVTGGAGYIGSHTCVVLLEAGHEVVVVDNLCNSDRRSLSAVEKITGKTLTLHEFDLRDREKLKTVFSEDEIDAVIHFAAFKAVGESVGRALDYYINNLDGLFSLCEAMRADKTRKLVFSSSATVYGNPATSPITEDFPLSATNPYGWSKLMSEQVLRDLNTSEPGWRIALLRYFNPVGAHPSGLMGEDPTGIPNNLTPYITQVAAGRLKKLEVFGGDYNTPDGTGVRDYIHVMDLAEGHLSALDRMDEGLSVYNLGTGRGYSVLEMVDTFSRINDCPVPYEIVARRPGDIARCYADASKARLELGWQSRRTIEDMCRDAWNWQKENPNGFRD